MDRTKLILSGLLVISVAGLVYAGTALRATSQNGVCPPGLADCWYNDKPGVRTKKFGEALRKWYGPEGESPEGVQPENGSLYEWLYDEARVVCNMLTILNATQSIPTIPDPGSFCGTGGTDPTRPPPVPECDWGNCPETD